jgi:hypothetical protein
MSEFQYFWRCEHHPSAIDNWAYAMSLEGIVSVSCEYCCDSRRYAPRWHDNGFHRKTPERFVLIR